MSAKQAEHYHSKDNYYTKDQGEGQSQWSGNGARKLGLKGEVNAEDFKKLVHGIDAKSGQKIYCEQHDNNSRRAGLDLTFSAPKSVSLAGLVGGDHRVIEAHKTAVERAMKVAEKRYSYTRVGSKPDRKIEITNSLVVAQFHHDTSRKLDPQLHTHCFVINATERQDGKWRSVHTDGFYGHSKLLGLVYQNELAIELKKIGYEIELKPKGTFELSGYSEDQLNNFSKRRKDILSQGATNQKEARNVVLKNRPKKEKQLPRDELTKVWQAEARELAIVHPTARSPRATPFDAEQTKLGVASGIDHCSERDMKFKNKQLEEYTLSTCLGKTNLEAIDLGIKQAVADGRILVTKSGDAFTTKKGLETESQIVQTLNSGRDAKTEIDRLGRTENILSTRELSPGQRDAIILSATSKDRFIAWQGVAGAGKTYAMDLYRELATENGYSVKGFAPSAQAAKVLEKEAKIESTTVADLLVTQSNQKDEVWIVDEAGLLSARDANVLFQKAVECDARVILVGDTRQLSAVEAGNPFHLLQQNNISTAILSESRRQKEEKLKEAVVSMNSGEIEKGLLKINGSIFEIKGEALRTKKVVGEYFATPKNERDDVLILAGTNAERTAITKAIRDKLKEANELKNEVTTPILKPKDLSREQLKNIVNFEKGEFVVFHKDYKNNGIVKNRAYEIELADFKTGRLILKNDKTLVEITLRKNNKLNLFVKHDVGVAEGDKIKLTRNNKAERSRNGQEFVVSKIEENVATLVDGAGKTKQLDLSKPGHFDHNFVSTVYSSQGKTTDKAIILVDRTFGKESMYVAVTRARKQVMILTDDKQKMVEQVSESRRKVSANELVDARNRNESLENCEKSTSNGRGRSRI